MCSRVFVVPLSFVCSVQLVLLSFDMDVVASLVCIHVVVGLSLSPVGVF